MGEACECWDFDFLGVLGFECSGWGLLDPMVKMLVGNLRWEVAVFEEALWERMEVLPNLREWDATQ